MPSSSEVGMTGDSGESLRGTGCTICGFMRASGRWKLKFTGFGPGEATEFGLSASGCSRSVDDLRADIKDWPSNASPERREK